MGGKEQQAQYNMLVFSGIYLPTQCIGSFPESIRVREVRDVFAGHAAGTRLVKALMVSFRREAAKLSGVIP